MKKLMVTVLILVVIAAPIYGSSGFSITYGEATNANSQWKNSVISYFQSQTDKDLKEANVKIITASEVNTISQSITGLNYTPDKIVSCALVDLSYDQGIKIIVDKSKITVVTPKMYANALKSTGIENGFVVVTSPVPASGESALTGVLKSYEVAVGETIPEDAKKAATEELYLQTQVVNQTGQNPDKIADLFEKVKKEVESENLQDPSQIKVIIINIATDMNINLTDTQSQQIADSISNTQKAQGNLTEFKQKLQDVTQQVSGSQGILDQIMEYLRWAFDYINSLISGKT
ncbi:MAG: DUF1002 domain-containing protein [Methanobacteriaceae archaeon]|nr:DUF1002 domain-containing protein [Methanobacteriaceae archaeon]